MDSIDVSRLLKGKQGSELWSCEVDWTG